MIRLYQASCIVCFAAVGLFYQENTNPVLNAPYASAIWAVMAQDQEADTENLETARQDLAIQQYLSILLDYKNELAAEDGNYLAQTPEELQTYYDLAIDYEYIQSSSMRKQLQLAAEEGLIIVQVDKGGLGETAGFKSGDLVLQVEKEPVDTQYDFVIAVTENRGESTSATIRRDGITQSLTFKLDPVTVQVRKRWIIGVSVDEISDVLKSHLRVEGVVVSGITEDSPAQKMGLQIHDVVTQIDGKPITTLEELREAVSSTKGAKLKLDLIRSGNSMTVELMPKEVDDAESQPSRISPLLSRYYVPGNYRFNTNLKAPKSLYAFDLALGNTENVDGTTQKLDEITKQLDQLREQIESLKEQINQ